MQATSKPSNHFATFMARSQLPLTQTDKYENLIQSGEIDPTKVVRSALQDAASVAGLLITTEAAIADVVEDNI